MASTRPIDVFFYGLFMDPDVLHDKQVAPSRIERASVADYELRIGRKATLLPSPGARSFGMVASLTRPEVARLYGGEGLEQYRPEAVLVQLLDDDTTRPALCYNLLDDPDASDRNLEYAGRLREVLGRLGLPSDYIESIDI